MANDSTIPTVTPEETQKPQAVEANPPEPPQANLGLVVDRKELIERGRVFLKSPQVRDEGISAKQRFLEEKGLSGSEITSLLKETVSPFRHYSIAALDAEALR